jgi:hypothetical protein
MMIQKEITNPDYKAIVPPFRIETIFYFFRSLLGLFYVRLTAKLLSTSNNTRIVNGWNKLFMPIRINLYIVAIVFLGNQLLIRLFDLQLNRYYMINGTTLIAAVALF